MPSKTNQLPKGWKAQSGPAPKRNHLPLYLVGGALLVIIVGIVLLATRGGGPSGAGGSTQVAGRPALAIDQEKINFGKVPLDKPVKAVFRLSNVGDQPLQILNQPVVEVKQGC